MEKIEKDTDFTTEQQNHFVFEHLDFIVDIRNQPHLQQKTNGKIRCFKLYILIKVKNEKL